MKGKLVAYIEYKLYRAFWVLLEKAKDSKNILIFRCPIFTAHWEMY